ncbi:MAG: DUF1573 domain-containing protein [Chitinophagales bacterium]
MQKSIYIIATSILLLLFLVFTNCNNETKEVEKTSNTQTSKVDKVLAETKKIDTLAVATETAKEANAAKIAEEKAAEEEKKALEKKAEEKKIAAAKAKKEKAKKAAKKRENDRAKASKKPVTPPKPSRKTAKIKFANPTYDFGMIAVGDKIEHTFKFTNTGAVPLIISDASSTCGCTIPKAPKDPIMPSESGDIHVIFDSTGKIGSQTKEVILTTNGSPKIAKVRLKGTVVTEEWLNPPKPKEEVKPIKKDAKPAKQDSTVAPK